MGITSTIFSAKDKRTGTTSGFYFDNNFGVATVVLSLATNIIATSLIACKAWSVILRSNSLAC